MTDFQSLSTYPVGTRVDRPVEEITVKAEKTDQQGFTFWDFLDVINPLQHIPVVNTLYREMTGDEIKPPAKMIGGAIIGGPIGLAVAMVDSAIEDSTGKDMGGHALAMFKQDGQQSDEATGNAGTNNMQIAASESVIPREFIPAALAKNRLDSEALKNTQVTENSSEMEKQTEVSIAPAAASAPQGMVFMPLPGRQPSGSFRPAPSAANETQFYSLNQTQRRETPTLQTQGVNMTGNMDPVALAQLQAQSVLPSTSDQDATGQNTLLSATKPRTETGKMPSADPFAAARLLAEETNPVMVPAWFDKAMMDAMGKYKAMQNAGS